MNLYNIWEWDFLVYVKCFLLILYEDINLICNSNSINCKKICMKWFIVRYLKVFGYSVLVCKFQWLSFGYVFGGEYEYIDVVFEGD